MNVNGLILSSAIFNITSDLIILLLPVRSVLKLQIDVHKKVGIILLFGTGLLSVTPRPSSKVYSHYSRATIASVMRIPYMITLSNQGEYRDISYEMIWMGLWSWAEIAMGIIVACTLSLPRLYRAKSRQLGFLLSTVTRPFSSLKSIFQSKVSRSRSTVSEEFRLPLTTIDTKTTPSSENIAHTPPRPMVPSRGGSFVVMVKRDISVMEESRLQ